MPQVSVIIPTHNGLRFLPQTLGSVMAQTCQDFEVVIVDNGSTDATPDWAASLTDPRIRYHWQEDSGGPTGSRNTGIAQSTGEFVAFLDADDLWLPEKLERQLARLADPTVGLVYTAHTLVDAEGQPLPPQPERPMPEGDALAEMLLANPMGCSTVMLRRSVIDEHELRFRDDRKGVEDWDLWLRVAMYAQVAAIAEPLVQYRYHAGGTSRDPHLMVRSARRALGDIAVDLDRRFADQPERLAHLQRRRTQGWAHLLLCYGHECLAIGDVAAARKLFRESLRVRRGPRPWWGLLKSLWPPRRAD